MATAVIVAGADQSSRSTLYCIAPKGSTTLNNISPDNPIKPQPPTGPTSERVRWTKTASKRDTPIISGASYVPAEDTCEAELAGSFVLASSSELDGASGSSSLDLPA